MTSASLQRTHRLTPNRQSVSAFTLWLRRGLPLFLLLALALPAAGASAQEPSGLSARIQDVDDSDFPAVRTILTVVDESGRPVTGLAPSDFEAEESGSPAQVSKVETVLDQQLGVAVILVIDTSGSMEGAPILQARTAARTFVENMEAPDQAAVVSFAQGVSVASPLTADRGQTLVALDTLTAVGNTALYSGVVAAVEQAQGADLPRKAIILLSDGQDFGGASQATRQQALDQAAAAGVPIYAIGLGLDIDRPFLEQLAAASGGDFFEAPRPDQVPAIYDQLSQLLRSQYVVTLQSGATADRAERNLRLVVDAPQGRVEVETAYTSHRTIAPAAAIAPTTIKLPAVAPAAAPAEEGGGSSLLLPLLLLVLLSGAASYAFIYYRRLQQKRALAQQIEVMSRRAAAELDQQEVTHPRTASPARTHRIKVTGPSLEEGFEVGDDPLVIGTDAACPIMLPPAAGVAAAHARFWVREGNLVLHHLAPGYESLVAGRGATWITLERNDEVQIGPYTVRVEG